MKFFLGTIFLLGFLFLTACTATSGEKKVLFYRNPMDPTVKSDVPTKDGMGMDYIPVYEGADPAEPPAEEVKSGGPILYYANPMDPSIHSPEPMTDEMGMDYLPVYGKGPEPLHITAAQEERIGVAVQPVLRQSLESEIHTVGKIGYNEQKTRVISARVPGRIEKLFVTFPGISVTVGQPLLALYSPTLITTQQELIQAASQATNGNPLGNSFYQSTQGRLKLWGLTQGQLDAVVKVGTPEPVLNLLSPVAGTVIKVEVTNGMYVEEGNVLFELSDLTRVWVEAEIFEKDLSQITTESRIRIIPMAYPDHVMEDKITFINPLLDPNTRTVRIRSELDNSEALMLPGMFVSVVVLTPSAEPVLTVPESAVLDTGIRKLVYVKNGPGNYTAREVLLKTKVGGVYPVTSGLEEGELVVTSANFLIDSESRLKGLVE